MPASKKPRKKYVPGAAVQKAYQAAQARRPVVDTCDSVRVRNHEALVALTKGEGVNRDWQDLTEAINVAIVLSEKLYEGAYHAELRLAAVAHAKCGLRHIKAGRFGYTGEELKHINTAMDVHDAQLDDITFGELVKAHNEVKRRQALQPRLTPNNVTERGDAYASAEYAPS